MDILQLLGPEGEARAHFRASNGDWVDEFLDRVVNELIATRAVDTPLQDITLKYGARSANVVRNSNDGRVQLNVRWNGDRGWSCYTADTYELAMAQMWSQIAMVKEMKDKRHV